MKFAIVALSVLLLSLCGCIEDTNATPKGGEAVLTPVDQQQTAKLTDIEKRLNELSSKIEELKGKLSTINTTQSGVTKADIDSLSSSISTVKSDISQLKTDVATLKSGQSSYNPYSTPYNPYIPPISSSQGITFTTTPSTLPQFANYMSFTLRISNSLNVVQYVKPTLVLQSTSQTGSTNKLDISTFSFGSRNMTTPCWSIPMNNTATNYFMATTLNSCGSMNTGEVAVPANGYTDVNVGLTITNSSGTYNYYQLWAVTISLYGHP